MKKMEIKQDECIILSDNTLQEDGKLINSFTLFHGIKNIQEIKYSRV